MANKKLYRPMFFILFILILFQTKYVYAKTSFLSNYMQTQYTSDSYGLPTSTVNDILQTADGYIWIATYNGLVRYDSKNFKVINDLPSDSGIPISNILCLFEDSSKRLWIGTNDSGLILYEKGNYTNYSVADGIYSNSIRTITQDSEGNIFIGSTKGINKIDTEGNISKLDISILESNFIISLICDNENRLWGIDNLGNSFCIYNSELIYNIKRRSISSYNFLSIFKDSSGLIRIGTSGNEIIEINPGSTSLNFKSRSLKGLKTVNGMYEDSNGNIWVCTDLGIGYFNGDNEFTQVKDTLITSSFEKVFEDYEHNIWAVSSLQGILKLTPTKFKNLGYTLNINDETVNSVTEYNNNIYIGTDNGLIISTKDYEIIENSLSEYMQKTRISSLFVSSDNTLWIGTKDNGLIRYTYNGTITYFNTSNSALITNMVHQITEDNKGHIIVATNNGINILESGVIIKSYSSKNGLDNSSISCIYNSGDTLYAGSDGGGIYIIKNDKITNLNEDDGLTSNSIIHLSQSPTTGNIWISTGNSLCYINNDKIHNINNISSITGTIFDIVYLNNYLWLLCSNGLIKISENTVVNNNFINNYISFDKNDGLTSTITSGHSSYLDKDLNLYIPCSSGLNMLNLKNYKVNYVAPKVAINSITIDNVEYAYTENLTIPNNAKRISIDFSILSFLCPHKNRIQYYLEGFDEKIVTAYNSKIENISYTNLSPGKYTLHIRGINGDNVSSVSTANVTIIKPPSFFERTEVKLLTILAGLAVIVLFIKYYLDYKTKVLVKQKQQYKDIIKQAIMAMANAIDAKDSYTHGHSKRVAIYSVKIAEELKMSPEEIDNVYYTALLHDIGKIGIPDNILNKPDRLTNDEYNYIKQHTLIGGEILKEITLIKGISDGARYHHERYDGKGYNAGFAGEEIPLIARIICVADTYDAMNSNRAYRKALSKEYILSELKAGSGKQFDPIIADIMIKLIKSGKLDNIEELK